MLNYQKSAVFTTLTLTKCRDLQLTFRKWNRDDDAIAGAHPESVAGNQQSRDAHKRESKLARA